MVACLSLFGLALSALAFGAATRDERTGEGAALEPKLELAPPRFFVADAPRPLSPSGVPIELLLLQIERHVRLEQAAAESFIGMPTVASLHQRTPSPLVH
jgi:hypothetical protein